MSGALAMHATEVHGQRDLMAAVSVAPDRAAACRPFISGRSARRRARYSTTKHGGVGLSQYHGICESGNGGTGRTPDTAVAAGGPLIFAGLAGDCC